MWWCLQESNQGHKDFQSFALPTELRYQSGCKYSTKFQFNKSYLKKIKKNTSVVLKLFEFQRCRIKMKNHLNFIQIITNHHFKQFYQYTERKSINSNQTVNFSENKYQIHFNNEQLIKSIYRFFDYFCR